jgi:hypothetical protein
MGNNESIKNRITVRKYYTNDSVDKVESIDTDTIIYLDNTKKEKIYNSSSIINYTLDTDILTLYLIKFDKKIKNNNFCTIFSIISDAIKIVKINDKDEKKKYIVALINTLIKKDNIIGDTTLYIENDVLKKLKEIIEKDIIDDFIDHYKNNHDSYCICC